MPAFFIAQYKVNNPELYAEYATLAGPTIASHSGELVAFDRAAVTIEGNAPGPQTVIIKFESTEKAMAWYESSEYQAIVGKRLAATEGYAVLSQSMNPG